MTQSVQMQWTDGRMQGEPLRRSARTLGSLQGIFHDQDAWLAMDPATEVYRVEAWLPVAEGTAGGLFWGVTTLAAGRVGDEYFMTHGHAHALADRAEFYTTASGEGVLLLMDGEGCTRAERMTSGSLHYIPGHTAHRVVNTGVEPLRFWACWPADAGHDYATILQTGFSVRVVERAGRPALMDVAESEER